MHCKMTLIKLVTIAGVLYLLQQLAWLPWLGTYLRNSKARP